MAHALKRILYCDSKKNLFAIVAKDPHEGSEDVFTHVFLTEKKDQVSVWLAQCVHESSGGPCVCGKYFLAMFQVRLQRL